MKDVFGYLKALIKNQKFLILCAVIALVAACFGTFIFLHNGDGKQPNLPNIFTNREVDNKEFEEHELEPETERNASEEELLPEDTPAEENVDNNSNNVDNNINNNNKASSKSTTPVKVPVVETPVYPTLPSPAQKPAGGSVVGYYMGWSRYKGFTPASVNASKLTHINYAFANVGSDLNIVLADSYVDKQNFADLRNLKSKHSNLRTLISVGGWDYSKYFSDAALNEENREIFATNCLSFILEHGFDGIDIDWEYPVSGGMPGNINRAADKENYTLMIKKLREKLNEQKNKDGRNYCLTVTGDTSSWYLNKIEASKIASYVDYIFIMAYDLTGPWDEYANFNAPLYNRKDIPAPGGDISSGINAYLNAGVSASKLILGVPFYGYKYNLVTTANNGIGCKFSGSSSITFDAVIKDYLGKPDYQEFFDETARVPYIFGNSTFISYDNEKSITEKAQFAKNKGLGGIGAWELSFDKNAKLLGIISGLIK